MKALILAGGEGKRLRPLTNDRPKPLLEVGGKAIIDWQIEWMKKYGINSFVVTVGYMKDKIVEHLGTGARFGVEVSFAVEDEPLGTGGAIKGARGALGEGENFVVANGDIITNLNLGTLIGSANKSRSAIALTPLRSGYGIVETDGTKVVGFREKPIIKDCWLNAGIYVMAPSVFDFLPDKGSVEMVTFPKLVELGTLNAVKFGDVYWKSIDSFKDFEETGADLAKGVVFQ